MNSITTFLFLFSFILCLISSSPSFGENRPLQLTLTDTLDLFHRQNLRLIAEKFQMETSKADLLTAGLFPNPQLSVNQTSMEFGNGGTGQFAARLDYLIETANKRKYRVEGAQSGVLIAEQHLFDITRQLLMETKGAFYEIVLAQLHLTFARENLNRFDQILQINTTRFQKGAISEAEFIKTRLQKLDFQNEITSANLELIHAKNHLKSLLGLSSMEDIEVLGEFKPLPDIPAIDTLQKQALQRPDFLAQQDQMIQNEFQLKSAKAQRFPDLTIGFEYDSNAPDYHPGGGGGISLSIPIFNRNQGEIQKADLSLQISQTQLNQLRQGISLEVEEAYRNTMENLSLVNTYKMEMINDAQATMEIAENSYRKGGTTLLDLLEAERTFKMTRFNYSQALFNAQKGIITLEGAIGKDLPIDHP